MKLTDAHIDYIIKDLHYRGIVDDGIKDEMIDHVCSVVESEMNNGLRFIDSYHKALHSFGHNTGLREIQQQTIIQKNKTVKIMLKNYMTMAFILLFPFGFSSGQCIKRKRVIGNEERLDQEFTGGVSIFNINFINHWHDRNQSTAGFHSK